MTKSISSLYDNTLQAPLQQTEGASSSYSSTVISNVARKCINNAPKEATASHNLTSCSNSEVLSNQSKDAKLQVEKCREEYRKKMSGAIKRRLEDAECIEEMLKDAKLQVKKCREEYRKKMSEAINCQWEDAECREKGLIELRRERADEATASIASHNLTSCSNSEVLSNMPKPAESWKTPEYRKKMANCIKK